MEDSLLEVVEGEVDFMRSAYCDEFIDLREQDAWKVRRPPEVQITLGPHHSQGGTLHAHVTVTLRMNASEKYPQDPLNVYVETYNGLKAEEVEELNVQLQKKAYEFSQKGMVVMLELCQLTQNYLSEHARPYTDCIYDEMVAGQESRRKASEEAKKEIQRQQEMQEEQQRTFVQQEVDRVKEELREEERQRRESKFRSSFLSDLASSRSPVLDIVDSPKRVKNRSLSEGSGESGSGESLENTNIHFSAGGKQARVVVVMGCISQPRTKGCRLLEAKEKGSGEKSVISQWIIKPKRTGKKGNHIKVGQENQLNEMMGKFLNLEKEMSSLLRLSQSNLIHYWGMKVDRQPNEGIHVYVLQEYVQGTSLKYFLDRNITVSHLPFLQHITQGVLLALSYLHQNNVVHRDLRDSSVFFDNKTQQVRVADYGVERKIVEVVADFVDCEVPSVYPPSPGRGGKKADIYRLGLIILSSYLGKRVEKIVPTLPSNLNSDFRNFLQRCLEVNEQVRWTAERLQSHNFIQNSPREDENSPDKEEENKGSECISDAQVEDDEGSSEVGTELPSEDLLHLPSSLKGFSRLNQEYDVLEWLGKGGFGHVYKVRNKVDDRVYALKRIQLDQQSELVRKKIIREVKLLSSLNHENVVRYYTSWIDELIQEDTEESSGVEEDSTDSAASLGIERTGSDSSETPHLTSSAASISTSNTQHKHSDHEDDTDESIVFHDHVTRASYRTPTVCDDESDGDDDDWLMGSLRPMLKEEDSDSDPVEFYHSQDGGDETDHVSAVKSGHFGGPKQKKLQFLNIQMQLCEKNTLRQAINNGLYLEDDRMWRLFREMVNGLDYIHKQGLIHRDLKPGNVFLDSADHVKIGDFGLATAAIKAKTTVGMIPKTDLEESKDSCLTGQVGTTLYIAPEVTKNSGKVNYTNKVDIFSLGVIFFEMIYPPLTTGMERVKVLSDLRRPEIRFPEDLPKRKNTCCKKLICWLLLHDPHSRPSTSDVLKSPLLPPPTAEEQKFVATLEAKLRNVRSSDYQEILNLVFKPSSRPGLEATFDVDQDVSSDYWHYWKHDYLQSLFVAVFKAHGGIWVPTSFYVPKDSFYEDKDNLVSLMARRGELVSAQYELRYPFARFVARNEIKFMRRYCIDRVQRASKVSGIHPKEFYECAFDIVCSKRELSESSARAMLVAYDIIKQILQKRSQDVYIRIGHMDLVRFVLTHCGIEESLHPKILSILKEWSAYRITVEDLLECLYNLEVGRSSAESLKGFLFMDGQLEDVVTSLQNKGLSSRRRDLASPLKHVLSDLLEIKEVSCEMGIKFVIKLHPLMVADAHLYCGFMCQFLVDVHRKMGIKQDLLAQGGSYEHLVQSHRSKLASAKKGGESPATVGVSLFLEKFAGCIGGVTELEASGRGDISQVVAGLGCGSGVISVIVCAVGAKQLRERVEIVRKLREAKITADHHHCATQKEAETLVEDLCVSNLVTLTNSDRADVRISNTDPSGRTLERKVDIKKVAEFVLKNLGTSDSVASSSSNTKCDSKPTGVKNQSECEIKIHYVTRKKSKDSPKLDLMINQDVTSRWPTLRLTTEIEVWAVELDKKALLALGALDTESTTKSFNESLTEIKNSFPEQKDHVDEIGKMIRRKMFPRKRLESCPPLILYSISSSACKRII